MGTSELSSYSNTAKQTNSDLSVDYRIPSRGIN